MTVTVADAFLRYLFNRPIRGSYDIVESMLLVFVFNGMGAGFFGRRNIVIDLLDSFVGERATAALIRIADLLSVLCLGLLAWAMSPPAGNAYGDIKQSCDFRSMSSGAVAEPRGNDLLRAGDAGRQTGDRRYGGPNDPIADRRGLDPVRAPVPARTGLDCVVLVGLLRQRDRARLAGRVRASRTWSMSPRPTRCRSCRCSS